MAIANSSVYHNVPVILQKETWACWYVSFQMVVAYQRNRGLGTVKLKDPSEVSWVQKIYTDNKGIGKDKYEREKVATELGFAVEYASEAPMAFGRNCATVRSYTLVIGQISHSDILLFLLGYPIRPY